VAGGLRLAGDLAELATLAAPDDAAPHQVRADVNEARAAAEPSLMAQGVFRWAARESRCVSPRSEEWPLGGASRRRLASCQRSAQKMNLMTHSVARRAPGQ
jgi:hypothetical protein